MQDTGKELERRLLILKKSRKYGINALSVRNLESKGCHQAFGSAEVAGLNSLEKLTRYKMAEKKATKIKTYHCFKCDAKISIKEYLKKKIRCPYCGSKILYKQRSHISKVKAR